MLVFEDDDDEEGGGGGGVGGDAVYEEEPNHLKKGVEMKGLSKVN